MSVLIELQIDSLRRALDRPLGDVTDVLSDQVELSESLYWQVPASDLHTLDPGALELTVGSLTDDIETMDE